MQSGFPVKNCPRLITEIPKHASIQREINMIREDEQNTIGNIKDILNEKNKIVYRYKRNIF